MVLESVSVVRTRPSGALPLSAMDTSLEKRMTGTLLCRVFSRIVKE